MSASATRIFGWAAPGEFGTEDTSAEAPAGVGAGRDANPDAPETPAQPAQPENHRRVRRNRVLMEGKLTYALGARSIDCTIRDLSDTGARVRLAGAEPMPEQVVLIQMRSGVAFDATVAWSRDRDLGLTFTGSHRLDEDCPPAMAPLRRLWLEHLPR